MIKGSQKKGKQKRQGNKPHNNLKIRRDQDGGFFVQDLSVFSVKDEEGLLEKMYQGKKGRMVRATEMNDYSSRSHSIFIISNFN